MQAFLPAVRYVRFVQASILRDYLAPLLDTDCIDAFTDALQPVLIEKGEAVLHAFVKATETLLHHLQPDTDSDTGQQAR